MLNENRLSEILFLRGLEHFGKFYSLYVGTCLDNNDSKNQNRIKVSCKSVYGSNEVHDVLILPLAVPMTSTFYVINPPQVGEEVLLFFRKGNIRYPLYIRTHQRQGLIDINTVLNNNNVTPSLYTLLIGDNILNIEQTLIQLFQEDILITIEADKVIIQLRDAEATANIQGDILRKQLKLLQDEQIQLTQLVTSLTNTLVTFMTASNVISAVIPPYAAVPTAATVDFTLVLAKLKLTEATLNSMVVDENKSRILFNN
jgi:hypothetical protein